MNRAEEVIARLEARIVEQALQIKRLKQMENPFLSVVQYVNAIGIGKLGESCHLALFADHKQLKAELATLKQDHVEQALNMVPARTPRTIVTEALISIIEAVTGLKAPPDTPVPPSIQAAIDRAVYRLNPPVECVAAAALSAQAEVAALRGRVSLLRTALNEVTYRIEQGRVWAGTEFQLTGLSSRGQQQALDAIDAALQASADHTE